MLCAGIWPNMALSSPSGLKTVKVFQQALLDHGTRLPKTVLSISGVYFEQIAALTEKVTELEIALRRETARDGQATLLQTMPGIGPMSAAAIQAFAPPLENFARGRDFAAWLGLVPRQHSSGGKDRLGRISKNGTARHSQASNRRGYVHGKLG